ncbi:MAG: hypothetical protein CL885_01005 [Dehalococcoidia bacterium]|nr:hypothetical protein [Dehalococcoidia bacterium]
MSDDELHKLRSEVLRAISNLELELKLEIQKVGQKSELRIQEANQKADQNREKIISVQGWLNKLAFAVLTAIIMTVLNEVGVL